MRLRVVLDTNVIVSAVLTPGRIPASLVALAVQGAIQFFLSPEILEEYRQVLRRPAFGFDSSAIDAFLDDLEKAATMVYPQNRATSALDDPDNRILECAEEAKAHYIITGNKKDFPFVEFAGAKIVSPAEFAALFIR
jgi:putative PIN family toxin of toxin-antitoxin system